MKLKAGKYYVGDPCYIFNCSQWDAVIEDTNCFDVDNRDTNGEYTLFGHPVVVGGTAYGDGLYEDNEGRDYGVDAGLIGILPVELIKIGDETTEEAVDSSTYMHIIEFKNDFNAKISGDGVFRFGHIKIDTRSEE